MMEHGDLILSTDPGTLEEHLAFHGMRFENGEIVDAAGNVQEYAPNEPTPAQRRRIQAFRFKHGPRKRSRPQRVKIPGNWDPEKELEKELARERRRWSNGAPKHLSIWDLKRRELMEKLEAERQAARKPAGVVPFPDPEPAAVMDSDPLQLELFAG